MSRKRVRFAVAILAASTAAIGGWIFWRAQRTLAAVREQVARESTIRVTARPFTANLPVGIELAGTPANFRDATIFRGHLFIAGPTGLFEYDQSGALLARYRVGLELPAAPLTALAVGMAADSRAPELWIGTAGEGLLAFDGAAFRQIRAEDAAFRKITALIALDNGRLLMGTEKSGVLVWDGRTLAKFHSSLDGAHVTALAGNDASLWIGTVNRGLLHWNAGAVETFDDVLPDRQVLSLAIDGSTVYAGTALGVAEIRDGKFTRVVAPGYFAQSLLADAGNLWIGTLEEGMVQLGSRRGAICPDCSIRKILKIGDDVFTLAEDSLWRGSREFLRRADSTLADRNISALSIDAGGRLWIGYFDRGLQILGGEKFEDDHLFCVNRIAQDATRGVTAVATANGLVLFDGSGALRRVITHDDGLIANQVTDVAFRDDGSMIAATPAGVSFVDSSGISSICAFEGLVNNHVYTLAVDGGKTLAGTLGGLSVLEGPLVKASFTNANSGLKQNWITAILRVGEDWFVGTYGAGVLRFDSRGHWSQFDDLRGKIEINDNAMAATANAVYAGTLDRGMAVYSIASGRWNFWTSGLPSRNVTAIAARAGELYIGTDNGLVKIPEATVLGR
ncbi:MAG TPA: hypothetical protein VMB85_12815 [Bryobacteraceae bacterium]|nr:hypothetical protein [Bryobacteraceae bacterium]